MVLALLDPLFWARDQDPFNRRWVELRDTSGDVFDGISVLLKPIQRRPVVIYAHGAGGSLMNDGNDLREIAKMGLAVVGLEYDQTNEAAFTAQFEAPSQFLRRQAWADTNAVAWVGFSVGGTSDVGFRLTTPDNLFQDGTP